MFLIHPVTRQPCGADTPHVFAGRLDLNHRCDMQCFSVGITMTLESQESPR